MTNPGLYGFPKAKGGIQKPQPTPQVVVNLTEDYGVRTTNRAEVNTLQIQKAFNDMVGVGGGVYLPGAQDYYLVNTLYLPPAPITFFGDGPTNSVLGCGTGTLLTYDTNATIGVSANAPLAASPDVMTPFSPWWHDQTGDTSQHYAHNVWRVYSLGLTNPLGTSVGTPCNGVYFPKWTAGHYNQLSMWMRDCVISNFAGTSGTHAGLYYIISGGVVDAYFENVVTAGNGARGAYIGSDSRMFNMTSHSNGEEGFYCDSYVWQAVGLKSYDNGKLKHAGKMSGLYMNGPPSACHLTNIYTQDNFGPGVTLHNAGRITIFGLSSDRNNWFEEASGLLIQDCHHVTIHGYDSVDSKSMPRGIVSACAANSSSISITGATGSAFPNSPGTIYIDNNAVTYTGFAGNTFTGCGSHPQFYGWEVVSFFGAQLHAIKVTNTGGNTNNNNYIQLEHNMYDVGFYVEAAVDPVSDLSGTFVVQGEGHTARTDTSPASIEYVQPGDSVTINRKFAPNAAGGIYLSSGAILRIL